MSLINDNNSNLYLSLTVLKNGLFTEAILKVLKEP